LSIAYVGGKHRQSKVWAPLMLELARKKSPDLPHYLEPFVGGGSMLDKMAPNFQMVHAGDASPNLIAMWRHLQTHGPDSFPAHLSKEEWLNYKTEAEPSAMRGFAGFGCSFYRVFFASYMDSAKTTRNGLAKSYPSIQSVSFECCSYERWNSAVTKNTIVYCDPPYAGSDKAAFRSQGAFSRDFSHDAFWSCMRDWRSRGALVFVSEYDAPEDFHCISELELGKSTASKTNSKTKQKDRLWI